MRCFLFCLLIGLSAASGANRIAVGLTSGKTPIEALSTAETAADLPTVLLIGGLDGSDQSSQAIAREFERYRGKKFRLIAIPRANPAKATLAFPPSGRAYAEHPEAHYLWRWIGVQAPDLVLIAGEDYGLAEALNNNSVTGIGRIPARRSVALPKQIPRSEASLEIRRRLARTPRQVADELARFYGRDELNEAVYINSVALIGQLRLGHLDEVVRATAAFTSGSKDSLARATSSHLSGHLIFGELAERTGDPRYVQLVRKAADLGFTESGAMKESMPLHNEMSDSVFMGCPILAKAGKLTHDRRYFEMALRHMQFMQKLCLRPDGIYRHSPLDQAAWGRGNAFPALGLALTLSDIPAADPVFPEILRSYRAHMEALARFQDESGMWREVIDLPGSYREFTATAMIGVAMKRGIRNGWLDAKIYQPLVDRAWSGVSRRTGSDGRLIDVCESTGKQPSVEGYLNRLAILDRDPRGGAMALLFATE